ncbi:hypothetical protein CPB97_005846 [Podila verticillata]|nr:hypothetical protein CPB97_005846 [Podila verticillata]
MDLNWCPVCEQHIPLAWETSLYCSDRCKQADAMASSAQHGLNGSFPAQMQSFSRQRNSASYSPLSSPTLTGVKTSSSSSSVYPSPPTSPMSNYLYNKTSSGRISPPAFSLGAANTDMVEFRRKSTVSMTTSTMFSSAKKGFF